MSSLVGKFCSYLTPVVARGSSVLAKSITPSRIDENKNLIKLDDEDVEALDQVHKKKGTVRYVFPPFGVCIASESSQTTTDKF